MIEQIDVNLVDPSPYQSRQKFDIESLRRLADDIKINGLLNPILCRQVDGRYEIMHGERRLRAVKLIPWPTVSAQVREATDLEARRICAAENVHRMDLTPVELIEAMIQWVDAYLMDADSYDLFGETPHERLSYLLAKMYSDTKHGTDYFVYKFIDKVEEAFRATNRGIQWDSFYNNDLRPYLNLSEDVKDVAVERGLNKSQTKALQGLKDKAPDKFKKVKEKGTIELGLFAKEEVPIEETSARELRQAIKETAAERKLLETPHVSFNTGDDEWYTPAKYISAARDVMGTIDLDPASTPEANKVVGAKIFYTAQDNGLVKPWRGNVWMNPPYAMPLIEKFCWKLNNHVHSGDVAVAIVLVNNATETAWFNKLIEVASAICFPRGRVQFWHPHKVSSTPLQGQAFIYIGSEPQRFTARFSEFGWTAILWHSTTKVSPSDKLAKAL
jgi:phage N-6-adenine-methyltransferase